MAVVSLGGVKLRLKSTACRGREPAGIGKRGPAKLEGAMAGATVRDPDAPSLLERLPHALMAAVRMGISRI